MAIYLTIRHYSAVGDLINLNWNKVEFNGHCLTPYLLFIDVFPNPEDDQDKIVRIGHVSSSGYRLIQHLFSLLW